MAGREAARHAAHAESLREALELDRLYEAAGLGLGSPAQLALVWRCSESRAVWVLQSAQLLAELPGGLAALDAAVLSVEQSHTVVRLLGPLQPAVREQVWARVLSRLAADVEAGVARPPARLAEQIRRWIVEADAAGATERRRQAAGRDGNVLLRSRPDGLVEVVLTALTLTNAEACLSRIAAGSGPFGVEDDRSVGKRRLDAAVDLLTGRTGRPAGSCPCRDGHDSGDGDGDAGDAGGDCVGGCGCPLGAQVGCGASVNVLVPLATALGLADVPAEVSGHGPIEPDLLAQLLAAGSRLWAVWVGPDGVPVGVSDQVLRPGRSGPGSGRGAEDSREAVWDALHRLASEPPGLWQPRHPDDHPPGTGPPGDRPPGGSDPPGSDPRGTGNAGDRGDTSLLGESVPVLSAALGRPVDDLGARRLRLRAWPHPVGTPGPYRAPARLRRLLAVRSPRCEWPGCGARVPRCDDEHDLAWPAGPTCACNLGPLCRRHHRLKQLGWTKHRTETGLAWTSSGGPGDPAGGRGAVRSPEQQLPVPTLRPASAARPDPYAGLAPLAAEQERAADDPTAPWLVELDRLGQQHDLDRLDTGPGARLRADRAAAERAHARQLAALRREVHAGDAAHAVRPARPTC